MEISSATQFVDKLVDLSLQDLSGSARVTETGYTCKDGVGIEQERVIFEAPLSNLVTEKRRHDWKTMLQRTLTEPAKQFKGITIRSVQTGLTKIPLNITGLEGRTTLPNEVTYAGTTVDLDLERPDNNFFDPNPIRGRSGIRLSFQDATRITRERLFGAMNQLTNPDIKRTLDQRIAQTIYGTTENPVLQEGISRLESTPLAIVEVTERITYADKSRKIPQPMNLGGARISEALSHVVIVEKLHPDKGHKVWERIPEELEWEFWDMYNDPETNVGDTINNNLLALSRHLATGK